MRKSNASWPAWVAMSVRSTARKLWPAASSTSAWRITARSLNAYCGSPCDPFARISPHFCM
jgi:hypothetical protein